MRKKLVILIILFIGVFVLVGVKKDDIIPKKQVDKNTNEVQEISEEKEERSDNENNVEVENKKGDEDIMYLQINDKYIVSATLEDNSSAKALLEKLREDGPIEIYMTDYANFEKVGDLDFDLPRNDTPISTDYGDIILYQGNKLVIYYDKNDWNLTKIGHIDNVTKEELKEMLGDGMASVILAVAE